MADDPMSNHKFWNTQPVSRPDQIAEIRRACPVDLPKTVDDISTEQLAIPSTFEWWTPDIENDSDLNILYELLRDNYVEDSESLFRFNYSPEFLRWALMPPGYHPSWHVGVRRKRDNAMLGFVSGVPMTMRMGTPKHMRSGGPQSTDPAAGHDSAKEKETEAEKAKDTAAAAGNGKDGEEEEEDFLEPRTICEINFLCVHKSLRDKRMAPILIKEVTRRVNLMNIWQAVYTAGTLLPTPFATGQYYHRSLNPEKLVAINFSRIPPAYEKFQNPMAMLKRFNQLPPTPKTRGLRPMVQKDVPEVAALLRAHLSTYDVAPVFTDEEVAHHLLPRKDVVVCYVVEHEDAGEGKKKSKRITDFFSFYVLPSTVIGNSKYSLLNVAYMHYYAVTSVPLLQLLNDMLIIANSMKFDVMNMVDILLNREIVDDLKFGKGDGRLHYYFYNWSYPQIKSGNVGLVML